MRKFLILGLCLVLLATAVSAGAGDVLKSWLTPKADSPGLLDAIVFFAIFASISFFSFSKMSDQKAAKPALTMLAISVSVAFSIAMMLANITLKKALPLAFILLGVVLFLGIFAGANAIFKGKDEKSSLGAKIFVFLLALVVTGAIALFAFSAFCDDGCGLDFGSSSSAGTSTDPSKDPTTKDDPKIIPEPEFQKLLNQYDAEFKKLSAQEHTETKLKELNELKSDVRSLRQQVELNGVTS